MTRLLNIESTKHINYMKKYLFTLLLALVSTIAAWAEPIETCVIVEFKSGETVAIALSAKPKAQFEASDLVLTSEKFEGRYATADIKRFYFDEVDTAIKAIEADTKTTGAIYDLEGRKVGSFAGSIDSTTLPTGVYVIKTDGGKSFKVTKK